MRIAVIGAGISGLTAARKFKEFGHETVIFEKSRGYGGRMATRYAGDELSLRFDHGAPCFSAASSEFNRLVQHAVKQRVLRVWEGDLVQGKSMQSLSRIEHSEALYMAPEGMNTFGQFIGNDLDIRFRHQVEGLSWSQMTSSESRKWNISLSNGQSESADALVIATPAPQAIALLETSDLQPESYLELEHVEYDAQFALMLEVKANKTPSWSGWVCDHDAIQFISNENSKRKNQNSLTLVVHATPDYTRENMEEDREKVKADLLIKIQDLWTEGKLKPEWTQLHFWRYSRTRKPMKQSFMEINGNDTPLALVGSYMNGNSVESAYISGLELGKYWTSNLLTAKTAHITEAKT